jgi:hypothetical protein
MQHDLADVDAMCPRFSLRQEPEGKTASFSHPIIEARVADEPVDLGRPAARLRLQRRDLDMGRIHLALLVPVDTQLGRPAQPKRGNGVLDGAKPRPSVQKGSQ